MAETVRIAALGHAGDGLVETGEGPLYVPYALAGETVEIERDGKSARLLALRDPSPDRVAPICRHFGLCGGCALQHMGRESYLAWKRERVVEAFAQRRIEAPVEPVVAIPEGSRRRAVLTAVRAAGRIVVGFHRRASPEAIAVEECPVLAPAIVEKLPVFNRIGGILATGRNPLRLTVAAADNGLDIAVSGARGTGRSELEALAALAADSALARLTVDGSPIFVARQPEIRDGETLLLPVPGGFLQASREAEAVLARTVVDHLSGEAPLLDLFAGIGTFALRLARQAAVTAIEGDADLLAAIAAAANRTTRIKRVTTGKRDLFRNPLAPIELNRFSGLVFDPPAAGARAQAEAIAASKVAKVAAVSCNPATLARDARILIDGGFRLLRVLPVDQFLFSAEIEAVATFAR